MNMDWSCDDFWATPKEGLYNHHRFFYNIDKETTPYSYYYSYDHHTSDKGQSSVIVIDNKISYSTNGIKTDTPSPIHKIIREHYKI